MKHKITDNVEIDEDGCWIWYKSKTSAGYGQLKIEGSYFTAHRLSYILFNGPIPNAYLVRHSCHKPACCNPEHLSLGSHKDNWKDSEDKHRNAHRKRAKEWVVAGNTYHSARSACEETGLSMNSLIKYSECGYFQIDKYREGCRKANRIPVV